MEIYNSQTEVSEKPFIIIIMLQACKKGRELERAKEIGTKISL